MDEPKKLSASITARTWVDVWSTRAAGLHEGDEKSRPMRRAAFSIHSVDVSIQREQIVLDFQGSSHSQQRALSKLRFQNCNDAKALAQLILGICHELGEHE